VRAGRGIERLRHQLALARKQQMTRSRIHGGTIRVEQPPRPRAVESSHVYPADLRVPSGVVKEMPPVRKDERRAMIVLALLELCGDGRLSADCRHSKERTTCVRREQNRAVGLPCAAARVRGIAQAHQCRHYGAQRVAVEVDRALRIAAHARDVVERRQGHRAYCSRR